VSGCGELARELLARNLVDEVRLLVHPVVWGTGMRPLRRTAGAAAIAPRPAPPRSRAAAARASTYASVLAYWKWATAGELEMATHS
jgi:riboflavin biosynthesis pyrimidine reductase